MPGVGSVWPGGHSVGRKRQVWRRAKRQDTGAEEELLKVQVYMGRRYGTDVLGTGVDEVVLKYG